MHAAANGIYFLANDKVFEQTVAFLNSLRAHNPRIPLCLIPYDRDISMISELAAEYGFSIFEDSRCLATCDAISLHFHGKSRGHYRKIAAWNGIFDEFIYIDVDTIVLRRLDDVLSLLDRYDVITAFSNEPHSRKFVWKDSIDPTLGVTRDEIDFAANTGFIASKKGLLRLPGIENLVLQARELAPHMELLCVEQAPLNYLIVKSTSRYTSLHRLNRESGDHTWPAECWPGDDKWKIDLNGRSSYGGEMREVLFVHWSGLMVPRRWERRLYSVLERVGIKAPTMRVKIKQKRLWRHYRNLRRQ